MDLHGSSFWQFNFANGFGLNTNILETNLVNLAVVIGVLVYFGKGVLLETLGDRRNTIVKQIEDAKTLVEEVKANLAKAEKELEAAREKVVQIHSDADLTIALKTSELQESMRDRQKRVQDASLSVITFENNKVLTAMRQRLFRIAMTQVKESLSKRITAELHTQIIDHQLGVLKSIAK